MIMVISGSQKFQFDRLLKYIDELIEERIIKTEVRAQTGYSTYMPKGYQFKNFFEREELNNLISEAEIIISHGGTGAIVNSLKQGKKVIGIPRQAKFGEHVDDHQEQIIGNFEESQFISAAHNKEELKQALLTIDKKCFNPFISNNDVFLIQLKKYIS